MGRATRAGVSPSSIIRLLVLVVTAAFVGWLSITTNLPRAVPAAAAWAIDPEFTFRDAGRKLVEQKGVLSDTDYEQVVAAGRHVPLADEPFLFFGMRELSAGNLDGAERLLVEARNRDPRNRLARIALLSLYLRTGRVQQAGAELAVFTRLEGGAGRFLVPELLPLARDPGSHTAVIAAIGDQPLMAELLEQLVREGADPEIVLTLARRQPQGSDGSFASWQSLLLNQLVERGEVRRARDLWSRFVGTDINALIYDPEFRGLKGPPPFNWAVAGSEIGAAELNQAGGLEIDYFGRRTGPIVEQLLLLPPNRYRLEFQAEGSADARGSRIVLRVACHRQQAVLGEVVLQGLSQTRRRSVVDFTVPAACDAQRIGFYGQAGEFPNPQRAQIGSLSLHSAGTER